jgi:hypothetical protein
MPTTQSQRDALTAATVPYALTSLGNHILDHELPAPWHIDVEGRSSQGQHPLTVWLDPEQAEAWTTTGIDVTDPEATRITAINRVMHEVCGILHGSCLRVRVLWHTDPEPTCDCLRPPTEQDEHGDIHDRDCPLWVER